jgi:hypothetical protein
VLLEGLGKFEKIRNQLRYRVPPKDDDDDDPIIVNIVILLFFLFCIKL